MNGIASRRAEGLDGRAQMLRPLGAPKGAALVEGFKQAAMSNSQQGKPRYSSVNPVRTQSSSPVDLKDPVQVHLLAETAMFDSREYEILSQEEVDELKKQVRSLNQMISQTRADLVIQSKYRDAAISMSKLYSSPPGRRKSILGSRNSLGDSAREVQTERDAIQKKCEELASELWVLERRIMEPQRRLLEHTAGILQLTHKARGKQINAPTPLINGAPASPESMYTGSNGRGSMEPDDIPLFEDGNWLQTFGDIGFDSRAKTNTIEIPLKSPVREQNKQLTEETEKLREENALLQQQTRSLSSELDELKLQSKDHWSLISGTERKLETLNQQLRQIVVTTNRRRSRGYSEPPSGQLGRGDMIGSQLEYLERALTTIGDNPGTSQAATEALGNLNVQAHVLLLEHNNANYPSPPDEVEFDDQVVYLQGALETLSSALRNAIESSKAGAAGRQKGEQADAVLMGLWDIIQSGYADIKQRKQDRRKTRLDKGLEPEDDEASDKDDSFDPNEAYSLSAFSTKVQWLYAQATKLKEQKVVLKRQIKQQRELNNKSDGEKDQALQAKASELEASRGGLDRAEKEINNLRAQLSDASAELEKTQNNVKRSGQEQSAAVKEAQDQLKERNAKLAALEASSQDVQMRLSAAEANIEVITAQLKDANTAKDEADKAVEAKTKEVKKLQDEADEMAGMVAEFKMEATLAKAELDGAYGTRKERAAEVAALHNTSESAKLQSKVERLQPRIDELEKELKGTVQDLKTITKQAIDAESKIADLESELDKAAQSSRKEKEQLQDALDHERLKASSAPLSPSGRPNASILTDSYRDALRAERKKYEEQLRNEQMNRRKLEEELRQLRKAVGPGKSPLSPR